LYPKKPNPTITSREKIIILTINKINLEYYPIN